MVDMSKRSEEWKLTEYFRDEGYSRFGFHGDEAGWSPAETAIKALREYDALLKTKAGYNALVKMQHAQLVAAGLVPT